MEVQYKENTNSRNCIQNKRYKTDSVLYFAIQAKQGTFPGQLSLPMQLTFFPFRLHSPSFISLHISFFFFCWPSSFVILFVWLGNSCDGNFNFLPDVLLHCHLHRLLPPALPLHKTCIAFVLYLHINHTSFVAEHFLWRKHGTAIQCISIAAKLLASLKV